VWVTNGDGNSVYRDERHDRGGDSRSLHDLGRFGTAGCGCGRGRPKVGGELHAAVGDRTKRIHRRLVRVISDPTNGFCYSDAIAIGGGGVWVANGYSGSSLTELNATTAPLLETF
jgi:hypothetical protein